MSFAKEPPHQHGTVSRSAVVLVNLGTPDAPTRGAVRRYLKQFLSDPRVVEIPRAIWWFILHGIILPFRSGASAKKYASIWTLDGSPLRVHTSNQAMLLHEALGQRGHGDVIVAMAMRYGSPSLPDVLARLKADGATVSPSSRPTRSIPARPPVRSGMPCSPTIKRSATCPSCAW